MKTIFVIHDKKVGTYFNPTFTSHLTELTRGLTEIVMKNGDHNFNKYPEDFDLYSIGTYDETLGKLTILPDKIFHLNLKELSKPQTRENPNDNIDRTKN